MSVSANRTTRYGASYLEGTELLSSNHVKNSSTVAGRSVTDALQELEDAIGGGGGSTPYTASGELEYGTGVGTSALLTIGASGTHLRSNGGTPTWSNSIDLTPGTLGSLGLKFVGDANTGLFSPSADSVSVVTNGISRLLVDNTGIASSNFVTTSRLRITTGISSGNILVSDGTGEFISTAPTAFSTLAGLTDTTITTPADLDVLSYDTATNKWLNRTIEAVVAGSGTNSIQLGSSATSSVLNGISIGTGADSNTGDANIAIGPSTIASHEDGGSLAIGKGTTVSGANSVGFGTLTQANGDSSVAIGNSAQSPSINSIALGHSSVASEVATVAIGNASTASGADSISFGNTSQSTASGAISAGANSTAGSTNSIAIGKDSVATAVAGAVALGANTQSTGANSVALGAFSSAFNASSIAVGDSAQSFVTESIAIGKSAQAGNVGSIGLGKNVSVVGIDSICIGTGATTTVASCIAIGAGTKGTTTGTLAVGHQALTALTTGTNNCAGGYQAGQSITTGSRNTLFGWGPTTSAVGTNDGSAVGYSSVVGTGGSAFGSASQATGTNSVALGINSTCSTANSCQIGESTNTTSATMKFHTQTVCDEAWIDSNTRIATIDGAGNIVKSATALGGTTFADNVFRVQDNGDATKQLAFECSGITTATTRTVTVPDLSGTLALTTGSQTLTDKTMTGATNTLTASLLKSATTEVSVSSATAPSNGQVLTATSSTTATWQTLSVGASTLATLTDTTITTPAEKNLLSYDATASKWINRTILASMAGTGVSSLLIGGTSNAGDGTVCIGVSSIANSSADGAVVIGSNANANGGNPVNGICIGPSSAISAANAIAVGTNTTASANNACVFGPQSSATATNAISLGSAVSNSVASSLKTITSLASTTGTALYYNANGTIGPLTSALRYKENIVNATDLSDHIDKLRPVRYTLKGDELQEPQIGFIAEEVQEYYPEFVPKDLEGNAYSVNYDRIVTICIAEIQKLRARVALLEAQP